MDSFFVIIYASFNLKCYETMAQIRIAQMRKRGIAFHFLVNGPIVESLDITSNEYTLVEGEMSPHLFWAPKGLQKFLQDFYKKPENEKYNYILRVNLSTFVNFERFLWMLKYLPKEKCLAGPFYGRYEKLYLSGTVHLFSKDVAKVYAYDTILDDKECNTTTEDVVTSYALIERFLPIDLNFFMNWTLRENKFKTIEESNQLFKTIYHQHVFFRIKSEKNREVIDTYLWKILYKLYG